MPDSNSEMLRSLAWPGYFVALLLIATPAMDFLSNVWPIQAGDVQWRYGSLGLLAGFLHTPLLGAVFSLGCAAVLGHRVVLRTMSVVMIIVAALLVIVIPVFSLDALQVRGTVPNEMRSVFDTGAAKAAVKYSSMAVALGWLGIAGIRATRSSTNRAKRAKDAHIDMPLVRSSDALHPKTEGPTQGQ